MAAVMAASMAAATAEFHGGGGFHGGRGGFHGGRGFGGRGGHFWHGRYWGYGVGPCWRWNPFFGGWVWVCG